MRWLVKYLIGVLPTSSVKRCANAVRDIAARAAKSSRLHGWSRRACIAESARLSRESVSRRQDRHGRSAHLAVVPNDLHEEDLGKPLGDQLAARPLGMHFLAHESHHLVDPAKIIGWRGLEVNEGRQRVE